MKNLRLIRKSKGLTMKALGQMVDVTESAIGMYETGKRKPSYEMLLRLSEALGCTVDDLMDETKKPTQTGELDDDELNAYLQELRDRPEMRMLFSLTRNKSKADVEQAVRIIEAIRTPDNQKQDGTD